MAAVPGIWLDAMLKKELGVVVDWSGIDREAYLQAMERSPVNDAEIKDLLKKALTDQVNDRTRLYEGYRRQATTMKVIIFSVQKT